MQEEARLAQRQQQHKGVAIDVGPHEKKGETRRGKVTRGAHTIDNGTIVTTFRIKAILVHDQRNQS
jgi:hypothetical protein